MAEQTTISRPAPYLEAAGQTLLDLTTKLTGQPVDTSKFAPSIAGQNILNSSKHNNKQQLKLVLELYLLIQLQVLSQVQAREPVLLVINLSYNKRQLIQDLKLIKTLCLLINKM
jgi:hypothetical protein